MSMFKKIFAGGKEKPPTPQEGIQKLREVEEMLTKKSDFLEKKVEAELAIARKNGTKNKRVALQALKRKKRYEKQLEQIDNTLSTIEFQREALENASTSTQVITVMGQAAKALKGAHNNMDVDKVHDLMDDVAEQQDIAREISEAISNPVGFNNDVDEDELLAELNELEQEELDSQLLQIPGAGVDLPSVPTAEPRAAKGQVIEDDDMRELEMWAS
ncbi:unnamed protein product [Candidula unifasciata]|uniref:Charged multivesicular body protein 4b n=1 Tax=Candidula unifasciata TaxID=100452 RepID=A0A8S3ZWS7_9EUPU|nr:unnamed protein product [Candidula unifasciata]